MAVEEITVANAMIAAAKAEGEELDRGKLNVPLLMEAQEILKIDSWVVVNPEGALWYRGLATEDDDPKGGPFTALLAKYGAKRFVTGHTPQQNARINSGSAAAPSDRHGNAGELLHGPSRRARDPGDKLTAIYEDGTCAAGRCQ